MEAHLLKPLQSVESMLKNLKMGLIFLVISVIGMNAFAEGTKEIMINNSKPGSYPNQFDSTKTGAGVQIWDTPWQAQRKTGTYASISTGSDSVYRIKIKVCHVGEVINLGFNQPDNDVYFRLYRPNGTTVQFPNTATPLSLASVPGNATGSLLFGGEQGTAGAPFTYRIPRNGEPGYINYFSQAYVGAFPATGTVNGAGASKSGYKPLQFIADAVGDYYICFNATKPDALVQAQRIFKMFDVTIWNNMSATPTVPVEGRLYCAAWDFQCGGAISASFVSSFDSELYFFSKDSVITAVKFNKMCPYGFIVTANSTGCANTGNSNDDRKSRILFNGYPEYPVFLKSPVGACGIVPKSSFGNVIDASITGCDNDRCINLLVDKSAQVGVTLMPPTGGPSFTPRVFNNQTVQANVNTCIPWDGLDGAGNKIIGPVTITINYFNGLTNLPLYDVEDHPFGYSIRLVLPTASAGALPIQVYWDDRPPVGSTVTDITAGKSLDGFVDFPAVGTAIPNAGPYPSHSSYNLFGCDPTIDNNPAVAGTQGCHLWTGRGNNSDCSVASPNCAETINTWWNANVIKLTRSYTPSNVEVYANTSHAPVPVGVAPYAGTPNDTSVCENIINFQLNGKIRVEVNRLSPAPIIGQAGSGIFINGTGKWTIIRGFGSLVNPTQTNASYTINSADIGHSVVLKLTSDSTTQTPCGKANDTIRIFIKQGPKVDAGPNQTVCKNNNSVTLSGTKAGSTSTFQWFGGIGTFVPNRQTLNAVYTPDPTEIAGTGNKTVILTLKSLTTTATGLPAGPNCPQDSSKITITYVDAPITATGGPYTICDNQSLSPTNVTLAGKINGVGTVPAGYTIAWKNAAGATFESTVLNPVFTPTAAEITAGKAVISLTVTKTSAPSCASVTVVDTVTIQKRPSASVAASAINVCANNSVINLQGVSKNNTSRLWTAGCAGCGTFNPVTADKDTVTFTPTTTPTAGSTLSFTFASLKTGCISDSKTVTVTFTAPPVVDAGPSSIFYCRDNPKVQLGATGVGQWWGNRLGTVTPAGVFIGGNNIPNPIYALSTPEVGLAIKLFYISTVNGNCNPTVDSVQLVPVPLPTVHVTNKSVCDNLTTIPITGASITGAFDGSSLVWTTQGGGNFGGTQNTLNSTYTPDSTDRSAGSVKLTLSIKTVSPPSCAPITGTMTLTFTPGPTVSAGGNVSACKNNPTVSLSGAASNFTTTTWSSVPAGSFSAAGSLNTNYTASNTSTPNLLILTASKTGCNSVADTVLMTFTNPPVSTVSLVSPSTVCKNNPVITLQGTSGTGSGHWTSSSNCPSCFSDTNAVAPANVTYIPSATDLTNGSVSFTFTTRNNGNCSPVASAAATVTIVNSPTATPAALSPVCENNATVNLSGTVTGASGGTWVSSSGCVSCFGGTQNSLNAVYNPNAGDISAGNVTFKLTTTGNTANCNSAQNTTSVTINKAPTADPGPDLVVCTTLNTVNLTGAATNYSSVTWSVKPGVGFGTFTSTNTLNTTYNISATDKTNGTAILILTAVGNPGCASVPEEILLQFTNLPTVNAGTPKTVCLNDAPILLDGSGSSGATWTCAGCVNAITNPNQLNATYSPGPGEGNPGAVSRTFTLAKPASGGCPAVTSSVLITINPAPVLNPIASQTICASTTSISLSATPAGVQGIWTRTGTGTFSAANSANTNYSISNADTAAKSVVFTFTTTNSSPCSAVKQTSTLTIIPATTVDAGPPQNICGTTGSVINLKGKITGGAAFINWKNLNNGSIVSTSNPATYNIVPADVPGTITFEMSVGATGPSGECPAKTSDVTYTIVAPPTVTASGPASFCQAGAVTLTGNMAGGATTGSWACLNCAGTGVFSPNNGFNQTTQNSVQYTPNLADTSKTSLNFQLTSFSPGLCPSVTSNIVTVSLSKKSTAYAGKDTLLCKNNPVFTIPTGAKVTNSTGVFWKSSSCSYPTTGPIPPCPAFTGGANVLNTTYTPSTADLNNGFVTLTLYAIPNGTCIPDSDKVVLTFKTAPKVNAGLDRSICANNRIVPVNGTVNAPYTGSWTTAVPSMGTAGFASATAASTNYTISDADTLAGFTNLVFTSKNNSNCLPDDDTIKITITRPPKVNAGPDKTICSDSLFVKLDASSSISANPAGKWTTIGGAGSFVNNNNTSDTAVYVFNSTDLAKPKISLIFTTPTGACLPISDTLNVFITPAPTAIVTTGDSSLICANQSTFSLSGTVTAGFNMKWFTAGNGSFAPLTASPTVYTVGSNDRSAGSVILTLKTVSPVGATCQKPASKQFKLKIQPLNVANAGAPVTVCQDVASISLATGTVTNATGGKWTTSGTGVFGPNPNTLGATAAYFPSNCCFATLDTAQASVTLTLTTTGNGVCPAATSSKVITFNKLPLVNAGSDQNICADVNSISVSGTTSRSSGSLWTRDPVAGQGSFTPTASNNLNVNYQLTASDKSSGLVKLALRANGVGACGPKADTVLIKIRPIPTINLGGNGNICATSENVNYQIGGLTLTGATGVTWSSSSQGAAGFDLTDPLKPTYSPNAVDINNGQVTITATTTGAGTCNTVPAQMIVFITKAPTVDLGPPINSCVNLDVPVELNAVVTGAAGGTWSNNGANGAFDDPNSLTPIYTPGTDDDVTNTITLTFTTVGVGSCTPVSKDVKITFSGTSDVSAGADLDTCFVLPTVPNIPLKGSGVGTWSGGSNTFQPSATTPNATYVPSVGELTNGNTVVLTYTKAALSCSAIPSDNMTITYHQGNIVDAGASQNVCSTAPTATVTAGLTAGSSTGFVWSVLSGSGNFGGSATTTANPAIYTPTASDKTAGQVILKVTTTGSALCAEATDTISLFFLQSPTADAGSNQIICADQLGQANVVSLSGTATGATSTTWFSPDGSVTFASPGSLNTTATVSAFPGNAQLQITSGPNIITCPGVVANVQINSTATPTVAVVDPAIPVCSNLDPIDLNQANPVIGGGTTSILWSKVAGTGSFTPDNTTLNGAFYQPTLADIAAGFITLKLSATNTGICTNNYDTSVTFTFKQQPIVNAGSDIKICAQNNPVILNGTANYAVPPLAVQWNTTSTAVPPGTFVTSANGLTTHYLPSPGDVANGGVVLYLNTTNATPCPNDTDYVALQLVPEPAAIVDAGFNQNICFDNDKVQLSGLVINAAGGVWSISGTTSKAGIADSTDLHTFYTFSTADKSSINNVVKLVLTSTGNGLCQPVKDTVEIRFTPTPVITVAAPPTVCADTAFVNISGTVMFGVVPSTGTWSSSANSGIFSTSEFINAPKYVLGPQDIANNKVTLTFTSNNNGTCNAYKKDTTITITPLPIANGGATNKVICANDTATGVKLIGTSTTGTGVWQKISGDGKFTSVSGTTAIYVPGDTDVINGIASLKFVTTGGLCKQDTAKIFVDVAPAPSVTVGDSQTVCADVTSVNVNVISLKIATGGFWNSSGTGTFADANALSTSYIFSEDDRNLSIIYLTFITTGNISNGSLCLSSGASTVITVNPRPVVTASAPSNCVTSTGILLSGSVTQTGNPLASGVWSSSSIPSDAGIFSVDPFTLNAKYFPSISDVNTGNVTLTLSAANAGTCLPNGRSITLNVAPIPVADAGADGFVCTNAKAQLQARPISNIVSYDWTVVGNLVANAEGSGVSITSANNVAAPFTDYKLTVTDNKGCINTDTVRVSTVADPVLTVTAPMSCYNFYSYIHSSSGSPVSPLGTYQWYFNNKLMSGATRDSVRVTQPGDYLVTYTLGACTYASSADQVIDLPRVTTPDFIGCAGTSVNANVVDITPATYTPYTYAWSNGTTTNPTVLLAPVPVAPVLIDTTVYYITVTDHSPINCQYNDSVYVISVPVPAPHLVADSMACVGQFITLDANVSPNFPPSNLPILAQFNPAIQWYLAPDNTVTLSTTNLLTTDKTGNYVIKVTVGQCIGMDTSFLDFKPLPPKTLSDKIQKCFDQVGLITLDAGPGSAGTSALTSVGYQWLKDNQGDLSFSPYSPSQTGQTLQVKVDDFINNKNERNNYAVVITNNYANPITGTPLSCAVSDTVLVVDACAPKVFPANAFHPGDLNNPYDASFNIPLKYINKDKFEIFIYSRWGEIIFHSNSPDITWNGEYRGDIMPVGVYAYTIIYEGKTEEFKGPFKKEGRIVLVR